MHTQPIVVPRVHSNGTGSDTLLKEYAKAVAALQEAHTAILGITMHARDYYVISDSAFLTARRERDMLLDEVRACRKHLELIHEEIDGQTKH